MKWLLFTLGILCILVNDTGTAAKEGRVLWFIYEAFFLLIAVWLTATNIPWN